jgi:hypothetical protein
MENEIKYATGGKMSKTSDIKVGDRVYGYFAYDSLSGYNLMESPALGDPSDGIIKEINNEDGKIKYKISFENGKVMNLSRGIVDDYIHFHKKYSGGGELSKSNLINDTDYLSQSWLNKTYEEKVSYELAILEKHGIKEGDILVKEINNEKYYGTLIQISESQMSYLPSNSPFLVRLFLDENGLIQFGALERGYSYINGFQYFKTPIYNSTNKLEEKDIPKNITFKFLVGLEVKFKNKNYSNANAGQPRLIIRDIKNTINANRFDFNFAKYSDNRDLYVKIYQEEILNPLIDNLDTTIQKHFDVSLLEVKKKGSQNILILSFNDTTSPLKWIMNWFKTNKTIPEKLRNEYLEFYGVKTENMATGGGLQSNGYEVELESIDNPDFEYNKRYTKKIKKHRISVGSIEEAKKVVSEFINDNDLGAGNFIGAQIYQNNQPVAYISYNLRVWAGKVGDMNATPYEENNMDIQNKIDKLKKVYNSTLIPEAVKEKALKEIEKLKSENINKTNTSTMELPSAESGLTYEQRMLNKKVFEIIEKNKINDANSFEEIVSEVLQDSNFHTEAFVFASILDKNITTKEEWYRSERFNGDDKTRTIALEISNLCHWDASEFGPALDFALRMKGFHKIAQALNKSLEVEVPEYSNAIDELTKRQTEYTQDIASRTGLRQSAVADFVAKNGLTESETLNILQGLGMKKISSSDMMSAVVGFPGNDYEKQIVTFAKSNEAFKTPTVKTEVKVAPVVNDDRIGNKNISEVATYIPHRSIKSIVVNYNGKEISLNGSDIFDGIYVENKYLGIKTRKKREPKVARTQFEEETFEFASGGGVGDSLNEEMKENVKYSSDYFGVGDFDEDEVGISQDEFEEVVDSSNTINELIKNLDETFSIDSKEAIYDILNLNKDKMSNGGGVGEPTQEDMKKAFDLIYKEISKTNFKVDMTLSKSWVYDGTRHIGSITIYTGDETDLDYSKKRNFSTYDKISELVNSLGINRIILNKYIDYSPEDGLGRYDKIEDYEKHRKINGGFSDHKEIYAKGGSANKKIRVSTYNQIDANDIMKYADLQNVNATLTKVGRMYKITLDHQLEERESMRSTLKQVLYSKMAKGGYTRPAYNLQTTGVYEFSTNYGLNYQFNVRGFEREGDVTDSLYFDDSDTSAKRDLGSIIIKNSAWKNLANGKTIMAVSSTGIKGKLTKLSDKKSEGGGAYYDKTRFPNEGEIVLVKDVDSDMMSFFDRTNKKLLITLKNGKKVEASVGKFYNDIIFHGDFPEEIEYKDYTLQLKEFDKIEIVNKMSTGGSMTGWKHKTKK